MRAYTSGITEAAPPFKSARWELHKPHPRAGLNAAIALTRRRPGLEREATLSRRLVGLGVAYVLKLGSLHARTPGRCDAADRERAAARAERCSTILASCSSRAIERRAYRSAFRARVERTAVSAEAERRPRRSVDARR